MHFGHFCDIQKGHNSANYWGHCSSKIIGGELAPMPPSPKLTTITTTTVLWPFFRDHPGEPVPEEDFWALRCKGRLTEADTLTNRLGATPSGLTSAHLHHPRPPKFMPMKMAEQQPQVAVVVVASEHYNQRNRDSMTRYRRHQSTNTQSTSARRLRPSRQCQVERQHTRGWR